MSETLNVTARIMAVDAASPVLAKLLANLRKIESVAKRFNSAFTPASFTQATDRLTAGFAKADAAAKSSATSYGQSWKSAHAERLRSEQRLHASIARLDAAAHARRMAHNAVVPKVIAPRVSAGPSVTFPRGRSTGFAAPYGAMAAGAGIAATASAFKRRMEADAAETKATIFGELGRDAIKSHRKDWIDRDAIKFGNAPAKVLDAFTESLKAGFSQDAARTITEGALKAQSALELDIDQLIKLGGKTATIFGGDVKNVDPARVVKLMNAIGVAAAETAADPNEVVEAFKKGNAALAMSKMAEGDLAAILSVGISGGIQPSKAGNAVSNLISTIVGGKFARGQRGKDLNEAARMLGFGSRNQLSDLAAIDPTQVLISMFKRMNALTEQNRTKVAKLLGGSEWDDENIVLSNSVDQIVQTIIAVKTKLGRLDDASLEKINSISGRWASITSASVLAFEKIGAGFESAFVEVSDYFRDHINAASFDGLTRNAQQFVDGIKRGFGFDSWKQMLDGMFGGATTGNPQQWGKVGKGIAEGLRSVWNTLTTVFGGIASMFGIDTRDAQATAKFAAEIIGLTIALRIIAPVVGVIGTIAAGIKWLGGGIIAIAGMFGGGGVVATITGAFKTLAKGIVPALAITLGKVILDTLFGAIDYVLDYFAPNRAKLDTKRLMDRGLFEKLRDSWLSNEDFREKYKVAPSAPLTPQPQSFSGAGSDIWRDLLKRTSFTTGSDATDALRSPAARALASPSVPSFDGSGGASGSLDRGAFEKMFAGTGMAGKFDQVVAAAKANGIDPKMLAGVMAHESGRGRFLGGNNPGGVMDPASGWARKKQFASLDDGINATASSFAKNFRRGGGTLEGTQKHYAPEGADNDPRNLNGGWLNGVRKQMQGLSGANPASSGASVADSIKGSAGTGDAVGYGSRFLGKNEYRDTAELASFMGGRDPRGAANAWCASFVNASLKAAGGKGTGNAIANSFQTWGQAVTDKATTMRNDVLVQPNRAGGRPLGPGQTGGHVGLATGVTRLGKNGQLQLEMLSGNQGDAVTKRFYNASELMVRRGLPGQAPQQANGELIGNAGITSQTPSSITQNVPLSPSASRPSIWEGGTGSPVAININGGQHDPEGLAALVQRRIEESQNWRTNDVEGSYQ